LLIAIPYPDKRKTIALDYAVAGAELPACPAVDSSACRMVFFSIWQVGTNEIMCRLLIEIL
jgi:hypothetical protein